MLSGGPVHDPSLRESEHGPDGEHYDIRNAGVVGDQSNQRVENLQCCQGAENPAKAHAAALEYVMEMILPGPEWRLAGDNAPDEACHEIIDRDRREPQANHRRNELRGALADTQCHPDDSETQQRTAGVAHE